MAHHTSIYRAGAWLSLVLLAAGCNGYKAATPANFTRALNGYYSNHDDCLFPSAIRFPYEANTTGADKDPNIERLDPLAAAGLLRHGARTRRIYQAIAVAMYAE